MDAVEIIAHRGSSYLAPENTRAAVELAWQEGVDAVEGDFRLTADGHIVALHDATLKRTAGVDRRVVECSLEELRTYDVGSWKGPQFAGHRVPTLAELLATVPAGKRFFVEVKSDREIIEPLRRVVENCGLYPEQIVPICLRFPLCQEIKTALPECPVYWVVEFRRDGRGEWMPLSERLDRSLIDGLDLMATGPITAEFIADYKRSYSPAERKVYVWTVDDPQLAKQMIDIGVDGITTNRPGWLREQLHPSGGRR
jgi:glycerophosphoryl diester phosphodiesterase